MNAKAALGRYGEDLAARRLAEAGCVILARNWRRRAGEVDIVAADGDALVICEVKTRRGGRHGTRAFQSPAEAVGRRKAERLRRLAEVWLHEHPGVPPGGVRIDLVGVTLPRRGAAHVEHVRGLA
jgi:putative endonuclease